MCKAQPGTLLHHTVRQHQSLHNLIEAIPEEDWTPIPYWMDGAADVAETKLKMDGAADVAETRFC